MERCEWNEVVEACDYAMRAVRRLFEIQQ